MNEQKNQITPEEMTGITLESGKIDVPVRNERGELTGVFHFNPTDVDMVSRYNHVAEEFNKVLDPLANGGNDDTDPIDLLNEAGDRIIELVDYVLGGNSKEAFFATCHPLSPRNGRFYCEDVLEVVSKLWVTLAANPVALIIALIAGLAAAFIHAYKTNDEFREKVDSAMTKVKEAIGSAVDWAKEKFAAFKEHIESARERISGFRDRVVEVFDSIRNKAISLIDKIKEVFNFDWQIPHIKLPHITVAWEPTGDFARFFGVSALPRLGVEWYKTGGIVDGATLIGAGEDGKEAIIPLERHTEWIDKVADGLMSRISANGFNFDKICGLLSTLNAIAETVTFRVPAVAAGYVQPYSIMENAERQTRAEEESAGILEALSRIEERLYSLESEISNAQFVAQFGDLRALARRITKEQRREQISEGR